MHNDKTPILQAIARKVGTYMRGATERTSTAKTNSKDFVTVADIKSQRIIEQELNANFPGVLVLSEEHEEAKHQKLFDADFTGFVIDPIDGTYNFKRDLRESAISIGYVKAGEPQAGVIYDPFKDELFVAVKGGGATRNGAPIRVSDQPGVNGASIGFSNSYNDAAMARNIKRHMAIYEQTNVMPWTHCHGSGVLIMANIACGRFDVYHHNGLKPWDTAAAFLLIREAGGKVLTLAGEEAPFTSPTVLTGNPKLVGALQDVFRSIDQRLLG